jgi:pyruvate formate lyase activating enzyme
VTDGPLIVDVKKFSLEDGPGIRSTVFFKGCPLRCVFCHNPETQDPEMEIGFTPSECIFCGSCSKVCDRGAVSLSLPDRIRRDKCDRCGKCVDVCPGRGLRRIGRSYDPESLAMILLDDVSYYRHSGGGVTLSGGEATLFPDYLEPLLERLKSENVHVALQTCGHFDFQAFETRILPYLDVVYFDIKIADPDAHRAVTGMTNHRILDNIRRLLLNEEVVVLPRVPIIPGISDTHENIAAILRILRDAGAGQVSMLPYNPMGLAKYRTLGRSSPDVLNRFMTPDEEARVRRIFETFSRSRHRDCCGK